MYRICLIFSQINYLIVRSLCTMSFFRAVTLWQPNITHCAFNPAFNTIVFCVFRHGHVFSCRPPNNRARFVCRISPTPPRAISCVPLSRRQLSGLIVFSSFSWLFPPIPNIFGCFKIIHWLDYLHDFHRFLNFFDDFVHWFVGKR